MADISRTLEFSIDERILEDISLSSDNYTLTPDDNINPSKGALISQRITSDGASKLMLDNAGNKTFYIVRDDSGSLESRQNLAAGMYDLTVECVEDSRYNVYLEGGIVENISDPLEFTISVNGSNSVVSINFGENAYGSINKADALVAADFTATITGGVATSPVLSSPTHVAGGTTMTLTLSYTGVADGTEILTIKPATGTSVYNRASQPTEATYSDTATLNAD